MNIARCPYAFPVYISGQLEDVYATDDVHSVVVRMSLNISWNASTGNGTQPYSSHNRSAEIISRCQSSANNSNDTEEYVKQVWIPQLFVASSQPVHSVQKFIEGASMNVTSAGTYNVHQRIFTKLWCKTSLRRYPFDTHMCIWYLGAFQAQNYSVQLHWDTEAFSVLHKDLSAGFDVTVSYRDQSIERYATLDYREVSHLSVVIKVTRKSLHSVILVFLPGLFLVIIAWISFYLPDELAEGRVLLSFLNLVGTVLLLRQLQMVPHSGVVRAIDVWMLSVLTFVWLSVAACFFDLKYAFRGLEREQQESVDDVVFFYQQPKLARQLADKSHREERQQTGRRRGALTTESAPRRFSFIHRRSSTPAPRQEPRLEPRLERMRRQSTWHGDELFWDAETGESPAAERVEWSEFYQWAHVRHAAHRQRPLEEELEDRDEDEEGSQWSVQSLMKSMWNIRKEYRWLTWSDYVKKCVEVMYPVFFCVFCVTFWLVYVHDTYTRYEATSPAAVEAKQVATIRS